MKQAYNYFLALAASLLLAGCGSGEGEIYYDGYYYNYEPAFLEFSSPSRTQILEGESVYVQVKVLDGYLEEDEGITLYLNGNPIRKEKYAPFEWNASDQPDNQLDNLPIGTHILTAESRSEGYYIETFIFIEVVPNSSQPNGFQSWSNPFTWGGSIPGNGADVTIAAGKTVLLDQNIQVRNLTVEGTLVCANKDLVIDAEQIIVRGQMRCGTPQEPFNHNLRVALNGPFNIVANGSLELNNNIQQSWSGLRESVNSGVSQILSANATSWKVGDRIVIGNHNGSQSEQRTIVAINGSAITLDSPLANSYIGQQTQADNFARVGLLTRDIIIEGKSFSTNANLSIQSGGKAYLSGIEFYRLGETATALSTINWTFGNIAGQYFSNNSISDSQNGCLTLRSSINALITDNVCTYTTGTPLILDDISEQENLSEQNLFNRQ